MEQKIENFLAVQGYCFEQVVELFPEVNELQGVPQNPMWHAEGDVFTHTALVCRAVVMLPEWSALNGYQRGLLFTAALFHDIGKKSCTREESGVWVSPYHAVKGAKIFRELCYLKYASQFQISFAFRETVAALIRYHGLPLLFMEKEPLERSLIKAREEVEFSLLYLLAKADQIGRICLDQQEQLAVIEYFREYTKELGYDQQKCVFYSSYTRFQYLKQRCQWPGAPLYDDTRFTVYVMSGLPLAGKDSYITTHFPQLPTISLDQIREELGILPTAGSGAVVSLAKERAKQYLREEHSFVWNATNITVDTRRKICDLCAAYGARVTLIYLEVPYTQLLERNRRRERKIPQAVLHHLIRKLEIPSVGEAYEVQHLVT